MNWFRKLWAKEPEAWWRKDRVMSRWDYEAWEWRPDPGQPYTLTSWYRTKAHADDAARTDILNIDCVSSHVTGPFPDKGPARRET